MEPNALRSQSQFSANPCIVVARATLMPIAPTLRAGRSLVARYPHPGPPLDPAGPKAEVGTHRDQRLLKAPNEIHHVQWLGQADDGVSDQLPGTVPGDLAAAVGFDDRCAGSGRIRTFVGQGASARGVHRGMLQQQQRVGATGHARVGQLPLQLPGRLVVEVPSRRTCTGELPDRIDSAMRTTLPSG